MNHHLKKSLAVRNQVVATILQVNRHQMTKANHWIVNPLHPFSHNHEGRNLTGKNPPDLLKNSWNLTMRSHRKALRFLATLNSPRAPSATFWKRIKISTRLTWWFRWSIALDSHWKTSLTKEIRMVNLPMCMKEALSIDHKTWKYSSTWSTVSLKSTKTMCYTEISNQKIYSSMWMGIEILPK